MTTQQSPDALAMARKTSEAIQLFTKDTSHWPGIEQIILRETKLRELCACAEALRVILSKGSEILRGGSVGVRLEMAEFQQAEQALAALNGSEHDEPA